MAQLTVYIISLCLPFFSFLHDEHYSLTNIEYFSKSDSLAISFKIDISDMDFALAHNYQSNSLKSCKTPNPEIDDLMKKYIDAMVSFNIDPKNKCNIHFIRKEVIDNDLWIYFSAHLTKDIKEINVMHCLFFDINFTQVNFIIFTNHNMAQGYKTTFYERKFKILLNSNQ